MNNIEILENYLKFIKQFDNNSDFIPALENLIKENKELKDTNKKLYELCQGKAMQEFINNECGYIHKSKVKEKIEALEKERKRKDEEDIINPFYDQIDITHIIEVLQELLGEGE